MALTNNFNFNPYYDDFNEDKKFLRILFKPGYAVQARELTQLQTQIQKQIERFGNSIFVNGSPVLGASYTKQICTFLKLEKEYGGVAINISNFKDKIIFNSNNTKRAKVIVAIEENQALGDPPTLLIQQTFGEPFTEAELIKTNDSTPFFATILQTGGSSVGEGQAFSINEGVIFYNGFFIKIDAQSIAVSKYDTTSASLKVGLEINEYFIKASDDSSLIDPAQEGTNYQAPGADRYKVELTLSTRELDATDDLVNFLQLAQFVSGQYQNTRKTTVYSKLGDEMAKRTFEESGNYVLNPFVVRAKDHPTDNTKFNLIVGRGTAYVNGYRVDIRYPETIEVDRARTSANVNGRFINANYGNFFYTTNHSNTFNINTLSTVDLHCVPASKIRTTSAATIQNTKIGTARVKSCEFVTTISDSVTTNFTFATEIFNADIGLLRGSVASAAPDGTKIQFPSTYSLTDDAYTGCFLSIVSGPGSNEADKIIVDYDGLTQTATVSPPFVTIPTGATNFTLQFNIQDVESLVTVSGTNITASADISTRLGIDPTSEGTTNKAILFDSNNEEAIFYLGQTNIVPGTLKVSKYTFQSRFSVTLNAGQTTLSSGTTDKFITLDSSTDITGIKQNYIITCRAAGGSSYTVGQIIPPSAITITNSGTSSITILISGGAAMQIDVLATLESGADQKSKTYVQGNTTFIPTAVTPVQVLSNRVFSYAANGQVHITANTVVKTTNRNQSLYFVDVVKLEKVYDFNGTAINQTNLATAIDVTDRYQLYQNDTDSEYKHSFIRLKTGKTAPVGPIVVCFDRYDHSSTQGYFSIESYFTGLNPVTEINEIMRRYQDIGVYYSKNGGQEYSLSDCLDFRPSWQNETSTPSSFTFTTIGPKIPKRGGEILVSFDYYQPRIDKLHLAQNGIYDVSTGTPTLTPVSPTDKDNSVTICEISIPAYTADVRRIKITPYDNRRYTMADIGKIDRRLKAVEYYTALSLLESDAMSKSDTSLYGRSKNGIITDSFVGFNIVDYTGGDYIAGINRDAKELTTTTKIQDRYFKLVAPENSSGSSLIQNVRRDGSILYLTSNSNVIFVDQPFATTPISVNPFNVQFFLGALKISPKSDVWIDTVTLPDLIIDSAENQNMLDFINEVSSWAEIEWGSWNNSAQSTDTVTASRSQLVTDGRTSGRRWQRTDTLNTIRNDQPQRRNGTLTYFVPETVQTSLGETVIDTSVIPYMRAIDIQYRLDGMRPFEVAYPFFDEQSISNNVSVYNIFTLDTGNLGYYANNAMPEKVNIKRGASVLGNADAILISNTQLYVTNVDIGRGTTNEITWSASIFVEGNVSSYNAKVLSYNLNSCFVNATPAPTVTTFTLTPDARNANFNFSTNITDTPVRIVKGLGAGQESKVATYTTASRVMTVSPAFTIAPGANSIIQIGNMKMDKHGCIAGAFHIPGGVFTTGAKSFKLSNQVDGSIQYPFSRAIESFYAQGTLQTKQERILSTISPRTVVDDLEENRIVSTLREERVMGTTVWIDPVAETFLVDATAHPDGIFLSKVRLCFQSRDDQLPVRVQIRPSVNGYPAAGQFVPFSDVTLMPDKVKTTDFPNFDDPSKYTEFEFESPVHLLPGEHALVVLSNSNNYFIWTAVKDEKDVNTGNAVGQQPYAGSFFKSQNGSTWTADQDADLMFRLYKHEWDTSIEGTAVFTLDWVNSENRLTSNANVDVMVLTTQDLNFPNTFLQHTFTSKTKRGQETGYVQAIPRMTTLMLDTFGSRVIEPTSVNSFKVKATLSTNNPDVTPILDADRYSIIPIENRINNLELSNGDFFMSNTGLYTSATVSTDFTITISGGGGRGAIAVANVAGTGSTRFIDKLIITNGGSGYRTSPTVSITGGTLATGGYVATAVCNGETDKNGGNSLCRYITKRITLADGFNSGDLRVYLSAHKPAGSNILVYYKILAAGDAETWPDREWQLMTQIENPNYISNSFDDFTELTFAPGVNNKANNSVVYTSATSGNFYEFNSFAIKIVMSGTNTVDVPRIRDFRAIATPAV